MYANPETRWFVAVGKTSRHKSDPLLSDCMRSPAGGIGQSDRSGTSSPEKYGNACCGFCPQMRENDSCLSLRHSNEGNKYLLETGIAMNVTQGLPPLSENELRLVRQEEAWQKKQRERRTEEQLEWTKYPLCKKISYAFMAANYITH